MVKNTSKPSSQLLRLPEVLQRFPVGKTTFYRGSDMGLFPAPVRLGKRTVAWRENEIEEAIRKLPRSTRFEQLIPEEDGH